MVSRGRLGERRDELVVHALVHQHPAGGGAVLARVVVAGAGDALGGLCAGPTSSKTTTGRLAAELQVDPLEVVGGASWPPPCPRRPSR